VSFDAALRVVERNAHDEATLANLAEASLSAQREEEALPYLIAGAERARTNARLWQWTALLHRALDDRHEALPAFKRAAALLPNDAGIAHGLARTAMEAGLPAVELFETALTLLPADGSVILGRSAALFAQGQGDAAASALRDVLAANPLWIEGHKDLAQIRWLLGDRDGFLGSVEQALLSNRSAAPLWVLLIQKRVEAKQYDRALDAIARATAAIGGQPFFLLNEAIIHSETGAVDKADAAFARIGEQRDVTLAFRRGRHDLRNHRFDLALARIEKWLDSPQANLFWPYAATVWRMTGDARADWLEGDDRHVSVLDIRADLPPLDRLAEVLRGLHTARDQHLDQSVRGGTQTDGVLFARIEPEIRQTRAAIAKAVKAHIAQLPPADVTHPTLTPRRDRSPRFSGSWSVRLPSQGFHANHVHPEGWLSSALYVCLPETLGKDGQHDGWFTTGCPQEELGLSLLPTRRIEPKPGTLVLFPSIMWHGTVPFDGGERLTIAFDVAAPLA
jgi:tetratricopeptide (TPR) repeat protein